MRAPQRLRIEDWREVPESTMQRLYAIEADRWSTSLEWETAANWTEVERGRRLGTVRGVLVRCDVTVVGWAFYVVHEGVLQVGGFTSSTDACAALMLDAILTPDVLRDVEAVTVFAFCDVEGLAVALRERGLSVGRYWYLSADLPSHPGASTIREARGWRVEDASATADLLMEAYGASDGARPFVPRGTRAEWEQYVGQLITTGGCGTLLPGASWCVPAGPGRLAAVALVSRIAPTTGHLVQLAVDPRFRRRGHASSLLTGVRASAARVGCRRMTLFVDSRNAAARGLYEAAGFEATASFVAAGMRQPSRSTSVAPAASVTTFR